MSFGSINSRSRRAHDLVRDYRLRLPEGNALVTLVGLGLLAWALGRDAPPGTRIGLYVGAAMMAGLAGAARVILGVHWFSDIIAGLMVGVVWLNLVILAASWRGPQPAQMVSL